MEVYRRALDEYGKPFPAELPMRREVFVAPTRADAIRRAQPYLEEKYKAYREWGQDKVMPKGDDFCDYDKGATTFHLVTMTNGLRKQLDPLLGRTISVKANALHCSETAWHIGDVVVHQWELLPK